MSTFPYQQFVFDQIRKRADQDPDWLETLSETLHISKSAVYKRLSGETMLSLDDLVRLMQRFDFSFDELVFPKKREMGFLFPFRDKGIRSFFDYLQPLKQFVLAANQLPELKVQYATNEFHFFFYLHDPDLTYFKFFMFAKNVWYIPAYRERSFSLQDFREWVLMEEDVKLILKSYYQISNVEIWNGNVLNNTLNQIKYALKSGLFAKPEEAIVLCDKLEKMIHHVEKMAELGKKFLPGQSPDQELARIDMYVNEITHTSNLLLLTSPRLSQIYFAFDNPNYIVSDDPELIEYTIDWFERIKRNALPISASANRHRLAFFGQIRKQIDTTRQVIENYIKNEL